VVALADTIPGATRRVAFEGARMLCPEERPEALSDELRAHWNKTLSQPRWTPRTSMNQTWTLSDPDREPYASDQPGTPGGHRRSRTYGGLDRPAALRAICWGTIA
jgi:hypothetical protein